MGCIDIYFYYTVLVNKGLNKCWFFVTLNLISFSDSRRRACLPEAVVSRRYIEWEWVLLRGQFSEHGGQCINDTDLHT